MAKEILIVDHRMLATYPDAIRRTSVGFKYFSEGTTVKSHIWRCKFSEDFVEYRQFLRNKERFDKAFKQSVIGEVRFKRCHKS